MNIEDYVCSLELSKKLRAIGVEQKSLFYWNGVAARSKSNADFELKFFTQSMDFESEFFTQDWDALLRYSAFTSDELIKIVPNTLSFNPDKIDRNFRLCIKKAFGVGAPEKYLDEYFNTPIPDKNLFFVEYKTVNNVVINYESTDWVPVIRDKKLEFSGGSNLLDHSIYDPMLCNALAKTYIYLYENGFLQEKQNEI